MSLNLLAKTAWLRGDYVEAERLYQRSLAIYQRINDRGGLASTILGLGETALMQQNFASAHFYLHDALQKAAEMAWRPLSLTILVRVAQLLHHTGRTEQAVALLGLVSRHPGSNRETADAAAEQLRS
ncbi:MAG TPA: tetratricopeptide repeat protein, partial [Caldilineaceae bacterium]|nr:tetratricopeptide repeat protein [Caldilineaceae bacterium]